MVKRILAAVAGIALLVLCAAPSSAQGIIDWGGSVDEYIARVLEGDAIGVSIFQIQGENFTVGANVWEDLWDHASVLIQFGSAAETIYVSADGAAAQVLTIEGLDGSGDEISTTATLNGTAAVTVDTQFWRVHKVTVQGTTAPTANVWIHIDSIPTAGVPDTLPGDVRGYIASGTFETHNGFYTCPRSKTCYLVNLSGGGSTALSVGLLQIEHRTSASNPWLRKGIVSIFNSAAWSTPVRFEALEDVKLRAWSTSASDAAATATVIVYSR